MPNVTTNHAITYTKRWDLGVEPPRINKFWVPPGLKPTITNISKTLLWTTDKVVEQEGKAYQKARTIEEWDHCTYP